MTCRLPHFRKAQTSHNNASASLGLRLRISMCRRGLHAKGRNPQTGEIIQIAASKGNYDPIPRRLWDGVGSVRAPFRPGSAGILVFVTRLGSPAISF
jgi:hypothetical protein